MKQGTLLINEYPLQVLPTLAKLVGLNEAIALQQLHFWLSNKKSGVEMDGFKWVYNTLEEWHEQDFSFWSYRTVQRTFLNLEGMGLVVSKQPDSYDRKKYYRIDYAKLEDTIAPIWHDGSEQNGMEEDDKKAPSTITETPETPTLTEEEKEQAGNLVLLQLQASRKKTYANRDEVPQPLQAYCDFFVTLTGLKPAKKNLNDWLAAFSDWQSAGLTEADLLAAWEKSKGDDTNPGFTVSRPGSLTNTATVLKKQGKTQPAAAPAIHKADPEKKRQPLPDFVKAKARERGIEVT